MASVTTREKCLPKGKRLPNYTVGDIETRISHLSSRKSVKSIQTYLSIPIEMRTVVQQVFDVPCDEE